MTIEQFPARRPRCDATFEAVTEILNEVKVALALVNSDPQLISLVPILEKAWAEAHRVLASLKQTVPQNTYGSDGGPDH